MKAVRIAVMGILALVLMAMIFGGGIVYGSAMARRSITLPPMPNETTNIDRPELKVFWEAWHIVEQEYIDKKTLDYNKMAYGAIRGMLETLGDPRTIFLDKQHYDFETAQSQGSFEGIGATVAMDQEKLTIVEPIAGSPAEKAGVKAGDVVLAVDGVDIKGLNINDAVAKIRGPRGSVVKLTIVHKGESDPVEIAVTRDEIKTSTVILKMLPDGIAHLRITSFGVRTKAETIDALKNALDQGAKKLVIDVRGNPGGILDVVVDVTSLFLKEGVVTYQVDADGNRQAWNVKPGGIAQDIPMVVLVNGGSASASEILAGALRDYGKAILIGEQTFGKGSVQHSRQLSDGSAIFVTISRWITPNGEQIDKKGLAPDIEIKPSEEDVANKYDHQLERAKEYLNTGT